ncbi:serine/threonine-protein kinase HT1-like protein [Trifolium pratense]|uniref:Serine/threonine-protein kinase HT1-like protein n=1 Tax=Trifolium pratense TaxID=57577 RepID=A0A2K3NQH9_TRIPR|nr:serine/threonine-protein kinase HT1-like protein [Trifolium pratense]
MDLLEGVGESSSPPRSFGGYNNYDVRTDVYNRLIETGHDQAVSNPDFREQIEAHFNRLPPSYGLDVNVDRAEDVLLHRNLLDLARDPDKRPVYHIRLLENISTRTDGEDQQIGSSHTSPEEETSSHARNEGVIASLKRTRDLAIEFESCSKLEDLNLDVMKNSKETQEKIVPDSFSQRHEHSSVPVHEIIFSAVDKPKLLSQLSALLSDIGLNIREAHVFSTTDGYSLDVFVVDGWPLEETEGLYAAMEKAVARSETSPYKEFCRDEFGHEPKFYHAKKQSEVARSSAEAENRAMASTTSVAKALAAEGKSGDWEIDRRSLKIGEKIASGSCGDLYHGVYLGEDVAVKVLKSEQLNDALEDEFTQEVAILRNTLTF